MKFILTITTCLLCVGSILAVKSQMGYHLTVQGCNDQCFWHETNKTMDCSSCGCSEIPSIPAHDLSTAMRKLILHHNQISVITRLTYHDLVVLDLSHNNISKIDYTAFHDMVNLETLLLSYNDLGEVKHDDFIGVQKLQRLDLNANRIRELHSSEFYSAMFRSLRHLDLSENGLEYMEHNAITDLGVLEYLKLSNNNLPSFDTMHFQGLHNLKTLVLDMNPLEQLKNNTFKPLKNLELLSMINCRLTEIQPTAFAGLQSLIQLTLTSNRIEDLGNFLAIQDLGNLETLILNGNEFKGVSEGQLSTGISKLYLSGCSNLQFIEKRAFAGLTQLKNLIMNNNNQLSYIAADSIDHETELVELDLYNNNLHVLDRDLIKWDSLSIVQLHGNPWRCDCRIRWMTDELRSAVAERIVCVSPSFLTGRQLVKLTAADLACHSYVTVHSRLAVGLIILSTAFLVLILLSICIKWRKQLLPCCSFSGVKYVALFNVKDGEDDHVTITTEKQQRTSIVRRSTSSLTSPGTPPRYERVPNEDSPMGSNTDLTRVHGPQSKSGPPPEDV